MKQDGRTSKGSSEDTTEPAKTLREESKARGAPSADELKKQVAFLELTDKKIRANMGGERKCNIDMLDANSYVIFSEDFRCVRHTCQKFTLTFVIVI